MHKTHLLITCLISICSCALADEEPWKPRENCAVAKRSNEGLNPKAVEALILMGIDHRITQTINTGTAAANYHGTDLTIDGKDVTSAVDISVRCLDTDAIRRLLSELARNGFAAWYRENGKDSWKGAAHIHAVWAEEPLKRQLRAQLASWSVGRTGLVGDAKYGYWQPTVQEKKYVTEMYEASKKAVSK